MENNTFDISDLYIGKVVSVNLDTHEIEVYLPKLMPTLNYGFSETVYNVDLQSEVVKTNTLLCKPTDFRVRVPKEGSLVRVYFVDGDIKKIYWNDFDPFGTNTYIEFEKTGNEKILEDFANMFNITSTSLESKYVGVILGSRARPFAEIFGSIDSEYVVGLDQKLKTMADNIANSISNSIDIDTKYTIETIDSTHDALIRLVPDNDTPVSEIIFRPGTGISITPVDNIIVIENTSPNVNTVTDLSATHNETSVVINSSDGADATINGANTTTAGVITITDQTFAGNKTFSNDVVISEDLTVNGTGLLHNVVIENNLIGDIPLIINAIEGTTTNLQE